MLTKLSHKIFLFINRLFDLKSKSADMGELEREIEALQFDDISKGKENIKEDFLRLRDDFAKSFLEAKNKLQYGGCLS